MLMKNLEGVRHGRPSNRLPAQQGHRVGQDRLRKRTPGRDAQLADIPGTEFAGEGSEVSLTIGVKATDGKGKVTAYATTASNPRILEGRGDSAPVP